MAEKQNKIVNTRTGHLVRAVNSLEGALAAEVLNKSEIDKYLGSVSLKLNKLQDIYIYTSITIRHLVRL